MTRIMEGEFSLKKRVSSLLMIGIVVTTVISTIGLGNLIESSYTILVKDNSMINPPIQLNIDDDGAEGGCAIPILNNYYNEENSNDIFIYPIYKNA